MSSAYDSTHRSDVIECAGDHDNIFIVGDMDGANLNPNDSSWNSTDRVLSFWYRGDWAAFRVALSTASGAKILFYHSTAGTDCLDGSGHVHYYLGASAESDSWQRFERNIEADFEAYSTSNAWTNTDGMRIVFGGGDTDFQLDDLRLSNSMTKEFRCLQGGYTGQIVNRYAFEYGAPEKEVRWLHYDGVGNVLNYSDDSGDLDEVLYQDLYGNVLSNINTGAWAASFGSPHMRTMDYDGDSELYGGAYDPQTGRTATPVPEPYPVQDVLELLIPASKIIRKIQESGVDVWGGIKTGIGYAGPDLAGLATLANPETAKSLLPAIEHINLNNEHLSDPTPPPATHTPTISPTPTRSYTPTITPTPTNTNTETPTRTPYPPRDTLPPTSTPWPSNSPTPVEMPLLKFYWWNQLNPNEGKRNCPDAWKWK